MLAWFFWLIALPDLHGKLTDPFAGHAAARVFLFARSDCPITNRYAPEWSRIAAEFQDRGALFTVVYPDRGARTADLETHVREYRLAGSVLLDPQHVLVKRAQATTAPEVAVFNRSGIETYHGRIDDLYLAPGKSRLGGAETHDLELAIAATLAGKPVAHPVTHAIGCSLADIE